MEAPLALDRVALVAVHARTGIVALNVLTAALRHDPRTRSLAITFAKTADEVVAAVRAQADRDRTVLVAWSFYSTDLEPSLAELGRVRAGTAGLPGVLHLAGGVHATAEPLATLTAGFDLVALGEGERTLTELVLAVAEGRSPREVAGLGWCEQNLLRTSGFGAREALDTHPAFNVPDGKYNAIEITRGCVYACAFCQTPFMFKARFRHRSVANVAAHAGQLRARGMRDVRFLTPTSLSYGSDDTSVNLEAVESLLTAVRTAIGPEGRIFFGTFPSEVRPEHVTDAAMQVLRRFVANDNLVIGGQSGAPSVLERTRRGHTVEDIVRAVAVARRHGFKPNVDFLFGAGAESEAEAAASATLMEQLTDAGARIHAHAFMPLPGTPLRDAPAGEIPPVAREALARLEARGRSYGPWRQHLVAAEKLARRRPR